jgi:hypothetical protein
MASSPVHQNVHWIPINDFEKVTVCRGNRYRNLRAAPELGEKHIRMSLTENVS